MVCNADVKISAHSSRSPFPKTMSQPNLYFLPFETVFERFTNICACDLGIGRIDIVENRFIGLKSRGCYDVSHFEFPHRGINVLFMHDFQGKSKAW
jgi:Arginosuccinate synthase